jgi:hypothetical protein
LACGERVGHVKSLAPNYDALFHCPNLQGVILGVGLAKLELVYNEQAKSARALSPDGSNKKKRKVATVNIPDDDDDDAITVYAYGVPKGKKAKGGTGYAGHLKEDVSDEFIVITPLVLNIPLRFNHRRVGKWRLFWRNKCAMPR